MVRKVAVTLEKKTVGDLDRWVREGKYPNRSRALQAAVNLLADREKRTRLARELSKLDRQEERQMAEVLRGEIYWTDLNPTRGREQVGRRPVLILSNDLFNRRSGTVIAMAITS
jgi:Arc/MetJ-type ribon-helix-helix transcriptional regulator